MSHAMLAKITGAFAIILMAGGLVARGDDAVISVGDQIALEMTGDLAEQYARRTGSLKPDQQVPSGLSIVTSATVCQQLKNGQYRIEHSTSFIDRAKKPGLVTLTSTVDAKQLKQHVKRRGPVYASPADSQNGPKLGQIESESRILRLELSELKGLKLRTWSLTEEIGD
jgi:hypothetical protein